MGVGIRWSPRAARQIEGICDYIGRDSVRYAALFAERVLQIVESIRANPRLGRKVPEYGQEDLRERIYQGYRIVYRVRDETIEVVAICHGSRPLRHALREPPFP